MAHYKILYPLEQEPGVRAFLVEGPDGRRCLRLADTRSDSGSLRVLLDTRRAFKHPQLAEPLGVAWRGKKPGILFRLEQPLELDFAAGSGSADMVLQIACRILDLLCFLHQRDQRIGFLTPRHVVGRNSSDFRILFDFMRPLDKLPAAAIPYCAPELLTSGQATPEADVFSVGALLYQILASGPARIRRDSGSLHRRRQVARHLSVRSLAPPVPTALQDLIDQMLSRPSRERPVAEEALAVVTEMGGVSPSPDELAAPLVGRDEELTRWAEICDRAATGGGPVVVFRGADGCGKSRLLQALRDHAQATRLATVDLRQSSAGNWMWEVGAARTSAADWQPDEWRGQAREVDTVVALVEGIARDGPAVLTIDGPRKSSTQLIRALAARRLSLPVATAELQIADLSRSSRKRVEEWPLRRMPANQIGQMAAAAAGDPSASTAEAFRTVARLGSPRDWHEFTGSLIDSGGLLYTAGKWKPAPCTDPVAPEPLQSRLVGRILELRKDERSVLNVLAVAEEPLSFETVERVSQLDRARCESTLTDLIDSEFVTTTPDFEHPDFELAHRWLAQAVLSKIDPQRIGATHGRLAAVMGADRGPQGDLQRDVAITRHLVGASRPAHEWVVCSVALLQGDGRYRQACQLVESAIASGSADPTSDGLDRKYVELMLQSGELRRCAEAINVLLSGPGLRSRQRAHLYWLVGRIHLVRGEHRKAITAFEHGLSHVPDETGLQSELKSELLCLAALTNRTDEAQSLADDLKKTAGRAGPTADRVWHALFVNSYLGPRPDLREAIACGTRAVETSFLAGNQIRALGRLYNLGHYLLTLGLIDVGTRLSNYTLGCARETGNVELVDYATSSGLVCSRRRGEHRRVAGKVQEREEVHRRRNQNPNQALEWKLERAKNLLHQSNLAEADQVLKELSQPVRFPPSVFEIRLLRGWWWFSLGRFKEAITVAEELTPARPHHFFGRSALLAARASLDLNPHKAARLAQFSLDSFSGRAPYYRAKTLVVVAEAQLRLDRASVALEQLQAARALVDNDFHAPVVAEILRRQASALRAMGRLRDARAHCLRGLQVARGVERPMLQSALLVELSRVEHAQGQRRIAASHLAQGISWVRRVGDGLRGDQRQWFVEAHLNPLLVLSWGLFRGHRELPASLLGALSRFSRCELPPAEASRALLRTIKEAMPGVAARIFLATTSPGRPVLIASQGHFETPGGDLISEATHRPDEALLTRIQATRTICGLPLRRSGQLMGLIQVETSDELIEAELDFLACLANLMTVRLQSLRVKAVVKSDAIATDGIPLRGRQRLLGRTMQITRLFDQLPDIAHSPAAVLLEGESGTGKELFARAVHELGPRQRRRFVAINCAAIPEELMENELFGNVAGSFTGARGKAGLFEAANGGTLFLDEVSSMPQSMQARLLRVLQEKTVRRIGESRERPIDVRVLAAANQSLRRLVRRGLFRLDLFYRLNVFHLRIPPLRERVADIDLLCDHFLDQLNRESEATVRLSSGARELLATYHFPGNVRELKNILESLFHTGDSDLIRADDVSGKLAELKGFGNREDRVDSIVEDLVAGRQDFWSGVRKPFLERDLCRGDVRRIVEHGLSRCAGSYRELTEYFGLPPRDYKRLLNFLRDHRCRVDFRPFRRQLSRERRLRK